MYRVSLISFVMAQQRTGEVRQDNDSVRDLLLPLLLVAEVVLGWTFQHYLEQRQQLSNLPLQIVTTTPVLQTDSRSTFKAS